jgi:carbamoyl-phosphate synthase small subunit
MAFILLESGNVIEGEKFGFTGTNAGELVFNTSMSGYQEILTDPSYAGQIIMMTYPLIGNYGISSVDYQSEKIHAFGFVCSEEEIHPSNAMSESGISDWLKTQKIIGLSAVDTREITKHIREKGTMKAVISNDGTSLDEAKTILDKTVLRQDYMKEVGTKKIQKFCNGKTKIAIYDLGIKRNIIDCFLKRGCSVTLYPYGTSSKEILSENPDGIFLSNGPSDPEEAIEAVNTVKELLGKKPIFGICMGHQILALALGAKTYKLPFGHRGANHGVGEVGKNIGRITSQNHSFAVDPASVGADIEITLENLNDGTVEGIRSKKYNAFSVQFHPEGSPGPNDNEYLFDEFLGNL